MTVSIKWFPPSWFQIKTKDKIMYIDPAWMRTYFTKYPKKIEYSRWPDPIDGLPEELEKADVILLTHHHKDHCKSVTVNRLKDADTPILQKRYDLAAEAIPQFIDELYIYKKRRYRRNDYPGN
ncbi:MAG: MBL fold metallo-hydrolase [Methanosarcinales archaeon]